MSTRSIEVEVSNESIKGVLENPDSSKLVILVHGFTGDWEGPDGIFLKLSSSLQQAGYAVLRFCFRGTPPSDGDFADMTLASETEDMRAVASYARKLGYSDICLLGESMGGTVVTEVCDEDIKTLVYWYPVFNFYDSIFTDLFLTDEARHKLKTNGSVMCDGFRTGKKFIDQIEAVDVYDKLQSITCPALILHGDSDHEVPHQESEKASRLLAGKTELHIIKGADHCFKYEQNEVIKLTLEFLQKWF